MHRYGGTAGRSISSKMEASLHRAGAHKSNRQSAAPFKIFDLGKADERYALYVVGVRHREKASNQ